VTNRVLLVRHAETESNRCGRFLGRRDEPLDARGHDQSRTVAAAIADHAAFSMVASSPSVRCTVLADEISRILSLPVHLDNDWAERDYGPVEGLTLAEARALYPATPRPGVERSAAVYERTVRALDSLVAEPGEQTVVVTHGSVLRIFLEKSGLTPRTPDNCTGFWVERSDDGWRVCGEYPSQ